MRTTTTIKLDTYSCKMVIVVTDQLKTEIKNLYRQNGFFELPEGEAEGMLVTFNMLVYHLLIDSKYLTHNTIAHETFHAVMKITEDRDIVEEEARAWLSGHINGSLYKFLEKKKLTIKHG